MRYLALFLTLALGTRALAAPTAALEPGHTFAGLSSRHSLRFIWPAGGPEPVAYELRGPAVQWLQAGQGWPGASGALHGAVLKAPHASSRRLRLRFSAPAAGSHALQVFLLFKDGSRVAALPERPGALELKVVQPKRKLTLREQLVFQEAQKQADDPGLSPQERERLSRKPWEGEHGYDPLKPR